MMMVRAARISQISLNIPDFMGPSVNPRWLAQGKLDDALKAYSDGLAIRERLAAADRSNTGWQRDLSVSYNKVGDVLVAQGKLDDALKAYSDGLARRGHRKA